MKVLHVSCINPSIKASKSWKRPKEEGPHVRKLQRSVPVGKNEDMKRTLDPGPPEQNLAHVDVFRQSLSMSKAVVLEKEEVVRQMAPDKWTGRKSRGYCLSHLQQRL